MDKNISLFINMLNSSEFPIYNGSYIGVDYAVREETKIMEAQQDWEDNMNFLDEILVECKRKFVSGEVELLPKTPCAKKKLQTKPVRHTQSSSRRSLRLRKNTATLSSATKPSKIAKVDNCSSTEEDESRIQGYNNDYEVKNSAVSVKHTRSSKRLLEKFADENDDQFDDALPPVRSQLSQIQGFNDDYEVKKSPVPVRHTRSRQRLLEKFADEIDNDQFDDTLLPVRSQFSQILTENLNTTPMSGVRSKNFLLRNTPQSITQVQRAQALKLKDSSAEKRIFERREEQRRLAEDRRRVREERQKQAAQRREEAQAHKGTKLKMISPTGSAVKNKVKTFEMKFKEQKSAVHVSTVSLQIAEAEQRRKRAKKQEEERRQRVIMEEKKRQEALQLKEKQRIYEEEMRKKKLAMQEKMERLEKERIEKEREKERERLEIEQLEEEKKKVRAKLEAERLKMEEEKRVRELEKKQIAKMNKHNHILKHSSVVKLSNKHNTTFDKQTTETSPKTPRQKFTSDENHEICDYGLEDLNSGDDTDDEEAPRKVVPWWAKEQQLKSALVTQYYNPPNLDAIFGAIPDVDLAALFLRSSTAFQRRTSSAVWTSPPVR